MLLFFMWSFLWQALTDAKSATLKWNWAEGIYARAAKLMWFW